jgi:hypothetical protein
MAAIIGGEPWPGLTTGGRCAVCETLCTVNQENTMTVVTTADIYGMSPKQFRAAAHRATRSRERGAGPTREWSGR